VSLFLRKLRIAVLAGFGLLAAIAIGITVWTVYADRDARLSADTEQSAMLARALEEHVSRTFDGINLLLAQIAGEFTRLGGVKALSPDDVHEYLRSRLPPLPQVQGYFVYGPDGSLYALSASREPPRVDGRQLEFVAAHASGAGDRLFVGRPITGRITGKPLIPVTRRVSSSKGTYGGVVGAALDPDYFSAFYRGLGLQPGQTLGLARRDGYLLLRFPELPEGAPRELGASPVFREGLVRSPSGTVRFVGLADGKDRIIAYRDIAELGLVVTIGHEVEATLAAWRREAVARFAILAGGLALSAILLAFTLGQLRRREADERLMRESEERFRKAFDAGPAAMSLISHPDGRYVDVNNAWLATYGYDRAEVIGRSSIEFGLWVNPAERARLYEDLEGKGSLPGVSTRHRCKSGEIAEVVTSCELIEIGGRRCLLAFNYDTTSQKRAEDALKRLNLELENRVQERTAKLEAVNKELETFTYSVSHDLKAPLRSIDGYSRLLLEGYSDRLDDEGRQFLHNVHQATLQMDQLIEDMLAYSRLERRDMQPGPMDPRSLIEALLAERAEEVQARGVVVNLALGCTVVTADRDGLTMALRNLLENALKFTRGVAQPAIEVGGRDTGDSCILWVRDNGVGFDMKYHERIFAIFQRLHRSEDYPGTGVGLAIVRKAMERMRGRAWAESEPGKGATFYLEIPK